MVKRLILVLGDQLTPDVRALREGNRETDVVVMAEVGAEATYVDHHPKKIAFLFSAMRHFAEELRRDGWDVRYTTLDDPENAGTIPAELLRRAAETGAREVLATEPGEFRLIEALEDCPIPVHQFEDDRFVATHAEFERWAEGRKELRMEWFYRDMRRKTGLLMEDGEPAGGKWNFDHDNRRRPPKTFRGARPMHFAPDGTTDDVLHLVHERFPSNHYAHGDFWFATSRGEARRALSHFVAKSLPEFGDYQDAMMRGEHFLNHAIVGLYLNAGLLGPLEVCRAAEEAWKAGEVPINAAEGFIRQIIGWREYVRGIYYMQGPGYALRNALGHERDVPAFYWSADTAMRCMSECVGQTMQTAYAHHIQRLMVLGNFALLAGVSPQGLQDWFMGAYADAYEWVMSANVIGMSQHADGGLMASKPYVSSGAYIDRMSDYCASCEYSVKAKTGEGACPFNLLYWHFLDRHRERFGNNPRMGNMYRTWDRMDDARRETVIREADEWLARLDRGERV
ncbi:deoxyribodipyrimidine photolyase-related protein [Hasllibacter halocynthiae]|uniref:Deoxyribodipyrimidine photolyase-related protein n=1 Tax=Hasllibacter halocynthiae TaxID=595589 RepID=A0A2T0X9U1_9RHOB|nr:cryptochrome/photolyase family protein [Hasllibacter halocynthiae]PRY95696.1 deoxyribodipyrimidine photolyase-related protein [Hasllibacter halocynthiae]